jgi:hypothetical protein
VATIRVRVSKHEQFGRLASRFREAAGGGLQRDVNDELLRATPPVLAKTRTAVLGAAFPGMPSRGGSGATGLRAGLARATQSRPLGNGVRIFVEGSAVGRPRGHRLAMLTDTELAPRWRHPVMGNLERWVTQRGQPWFFVSIRGEEQRFARGVLAAMDKTARRIMR